MDVNKLVILKCLELAIAAVCIGFHYRSRTNDFDCDTISSAAFGGFVIISAGGFIGYLVNKPINKIIDAFFCLVGCGIFIAAGSLNLEFFQNFTKSEWKYFGLAKAILAIVNGGIFLLNSILSWRYEYM